MVGTPSSTGCSNCRRRKKKCGEEKPNCVACLKSGWKCPGYARKWKFVDENPQMATYFKKKKYLFEGFSEIEHYLNAPKVTVRHDDGEFRGASELYRVANGAFSVEVDCPIVSKANSAGALFNYILMSPSAVFLYCLPRLEDFLLTIPSMMGRNPALDEAAICICQFWIHILQKGLYIASSAEVLGSYNSSLNALQRCIRDPVLRTKTETICASILVQMMELILATHEHFPVVRWPGLFDGTQMLIMESGPDKFDGYEEMNVLWSSRELITLQCVYASRPCWLGEIGWREKFAKPPDRGPPRELGLVDRTTELLLAVARNLSDINEILDCGDEIPSPEILEERQQQLMQRVLGLKKRVEVFYTTDFEPQLRDIKAEAANEDERAKWFDANKGLYFSHLYGMKLLTIFDCTLTSVLIRLFRILSCLEQNRRWRGRLVPPLLFQSHGLAEREAHLNDVFVELKTISPPQARAIDFWLTDLWVDNYLQSPILNARGAQGLG